MTAQGPSRPLTEAVIELAGRAIRSADRSLAQAALLASERLRQPLCVAVVGRVSAGKSTVLNALLGEAISPTAGDECTKVVYVFRHSRYTSAVAYPRDDSAPVALPLEGSRLPATLPLPAAELSRVEVTLPAPLLERVTLVDTPGMASTNTENAEETARLLADTEDAAASADALLFCLNSPLKDDEAEAVRMFRAGRGGSRLTGGSAVALLTKADQVGEDLRTRWKAATELAHTMSTVHADLFAGVLPVIGLLAQTATAGALRELHARWLAALARTWNPDQSKIALLEKDMFLRWPGPVAAEEREQLIKLLGLFGIAEFLDALRAGTPANAAALTAVARRVSGFDHMRARLDVALGARADALKAAGALEALMDRAHAAGDRNVYDEAQRLLDRPEMFPLRILEIARLLATGQARPPEGLAEEAWVVVTMGLASATAREAAQRAAAWRHWSTLTDGVGQHVARVMVRAWQLAAGEGAGHA